MSGRRRSLLARLGVLSAAVVLALVAAELFVRLAAPAPEPLEPYRVRVQHRGRWVDLERGAHALLLEPSDDPALADLERGVPRPDLDFRLCYDVRHGFRRPYFDADGCVTFHINAERHRGPLRPHAKPPGVYRIVLVGDSFTFGHGVPYEACWGTVLEGILDAGLADSGELRHVEVVNLAVSGYDVEDVALVTRARALTWQPDRILYGFFLNDLLVGDAEASGDEAWRGVDEAELHDAVFGARTGLAARSALVALVRRVLASRRVDGLTRRTYLDAGRPGSPHFEAWDAALGRMVAAAAGAGVPLDVVVFPELIDLDASHPFVSVYAEVERSARARGSGVVQVLEAWRGQEASALWVHPTDHHPNELAHASAAARIARHLRALEPSL